MNKILTQNEIQSTIENLRSKNNALKIVQCHGVFDLVHPGHIEHFKKAKSNGDILIVTITADKYINKGPNRPYFDQIRRANFLEQLEIIDFVFIVESKSAVDAINLIAPDYYVKGSDYQNLKADITGKIIEEKNAVEKHGGRLVFTDGFTSSSTMLINNELFPQNTEIRAWVKDFKKKYTLENVFYWIDKLGKISVNVLGETIIDIYTECKPLAKSSKDPILAFHKFETRKFLGGVLAIADSCSNWSKDTTVHSICGNDLDQHIIESGQILKFNSEITQLHDHKTIIKHRFVDINSGNRVFEYYDYSPEPFNTKLQELILEKLNNVLNSRSLIVLADYGHGLFGEIIIEQISKALAFIAVNTQSNAGNRGFNTFSKYPRIDFLSLNGAELELELRKKNLDYFKVVPEIMEQKKCKNTIVTLGGDGLITFDSDGDGVITPAFATKVVDKVGAGDSVLAIASMLSFVSAPKEIIGLLSSIVAAYEVAQLGHKNSVSKVELKKYVAGLLG